MKLKRWDATEHLQSEADIQAYLQAAVAEAGNDASFIAEVLGDIARARGMTELSKATGLGRESLYKSLSGQANPSFETVLKVSHALGFELKFSPLKPSKAGAARRTKTSAAMA